MNYFFARAFKFAAAIHFLTQASIAATAPKAPTFSKGGSRWLCDSQCAKNIFRFSTIGIETPGSSGSGVIIGFKDGVFTALTAAHVMSDFNSTEKFYAVSLPYNKRYKIISTDFPSKGNLDIAVVRFKATEPLYIQPLNFFINAPTTEGSEWGTDNDGARGAGISLPSGAVTVPIMRFNEFATQPRAEGNKDGYEFLYIASTVPGMSGGPIVGWRQACETEGVYKGAGYFSLIAIHGRSEEYSSGGRSGLSLAVPVQLIENFLRKKSTTYGIPSTIEAINTIEINQYCRP